MYKLLFRYQRANYETIKLCIAHIKVENNMAPSIWPKNKLETVKGPRIEVLHK